MSCRRRLPVLALLLVACASPPPGASAPGSSSADQPTPTASMIDAEATPSSTVVPMATEQELARAHTRFLSDPPSFHGLFESHEANEPQPIRWELWVRWPAFRVETIFQGAHVIVATEDGERFTYREGDQVGSTHTLGEQAAIMLSPLFQFSDAGLPPIACPSEEILGVDDMLGRRAIHVACSEGSESWIDSESGLVLAYQASDAGAGGESSTGYSSIEFDPGFDEAVFDATAS
jgi:hypothetical protein